MSTNHNNKNNKTSVNRMTTDIKTKPSVSKKNELRRKKLKQRKRRRIISIIVISLFVLVIIFSSSILLTMGKVKRTDLDNDNLGISDKFINDLNYSDAFGDIVNIAMFGVDQEVDNIQRSDAIMIGTLDTVNKKIKITSIMRDTYVNIPDYGYDKLNHAYAYGGPELAIKTINKNFDLNITDYVAVDFTQLQEIIDAMGGVDMELSDDELKKLNRHLESAYGLKGSPTKFVSVGKNGTVHLDGFQALGYTRIRNTAGGDFERTERQRKIMSEMFDKVSGSGVGKLATMMNKMLPYVETSLSNKEILTLGTQLITTGSASVEQERFPRDEYSENSLINDIFYLTFDEDIAREEIYQYLFKDIKLWNNPTKE